MTTAKHFPLHFGYIWWDCLPSNRKYQAEQHIKKTIVVQSSNVLDARQIGLKLDLHKHHHISGILGIEFTPDDSKELTIEIAVKDTRLGDGPVSSGLPKQFAEVVLDEMTKALQEVSFISGGKSRSTMQLGI